MLVKVAPPLSQRTSADRRLGFFLVGGGLMGLVMAFIIMAEKLRLLENPNYVPPCDAGLIVSCSSIMKSDQAHVFGFPNPILGLMAFPVVIFFGVLLVSAASVPKWMWLGLNVGTVAGLMFVHWLAYQSIFNIGALCPFCMVTWATVISMFLYVTRRNLQAYRPDTGISVLVSGWHTVLLTVWLAVLGGLIWFVLIL